METLDNNPYHIPEVKLEKTVEFNLYNDENYPFQRFNILNSKEEIVGEVDILKDSYQKKMWVTIISIFEEFQKGFGTATYIQLSRDFPDHVLHSSNRFAINVEGVRPVKKLWERFVRWGIAEESENGGFRFVSINEV